MQRDIRANEIDWVFCWRTMTGEVRPGARDTHRSGRPVPYQPNRGSAEGGLRTIVRGRVRTCPGPPVGPRLDQQGAISRMCCFVSGYVTYSSVVPARTRRELGVLRDAARAAVFSGDAKEWALAAIRARKRVHWAIHIGALPAVVSDLARRVDAPWTLDIREKDFVRPDGSHWVKGAQIFCLDQSGQTTETLEANSVFDDARLPRFGSRSRSLERGDRGLTASQGGAIACPHERPIGRGAWERWVKQDDRRT